MGVQRDGWDPTSGQNCYLNQYKLCVCNEIGFLLLFRYLKADVKHECEPVSEGAW